MGADQDDVGGLGRCRLDDRLGRVARPDEERDRNPEAAPAVDEGLRRGLASLPDLIDARPEAATREHELPWVDDAYDQ